MSQKGSKENIAESNPLLEDDGAEKNGETPEKEEKVKVPKVPKPKGPSCVETLSSGLDMTARDKDGINVEIDLDFADVLAEPSSAHGFDPMWRLSFILFSNTK